MPRHFRKVAESIEVHLFPGRRGAACRFTVAMAVGVVVLLCQGDAKSAAPRPPEPGDDVLKFLDQTIDWYRHVSALEANAMTSEEAQSRDAARQHARDAVRRAFAFARADAVLLTDKQKANPTTRPGNLTKLARATGAAEKRVTDVQAQLDQVNQQIAKADPAAVAALTARRDKLNSELELATERRDVLRNLSGFMSQSAAGSVEGLSARIEDLARSVPEIQTEADQSSPASPAGKAATPPAAAPKGFDPESAGVFSLLNATFTLPGQLNELQAAANRAEELEKAAEKLRAPIRAELMDAIHQADAIAAAPDTDDPAKLDQQREQLDTLSTRFKQLSAAAVPLSELDVDLGSTRATVTQWRTTLEHDYARAARYLCMRLGAMAVAILCLLAVSALWRHATFRYVGDARRRRQFLVVRRIVVSALVVVIILFTFVTEFSSLATFAGIMTAGVAVALQTFIVSGVAYFFFVGRYGVRVGERVTISNITGDVVEIGLFRLYLMELGGTGLDRHATGRIVVFSNSVLFQPNAFFKQIPGAEYSWHQVSLTLAPGSDYPLAERRLLAAVESVFAGYQAEIDRQHDAVDQWMHVPLPKPRPEARLRFIETGVELVIRYPVDIRRAPEIDDLLGRRFLEEINAEPPLKLQGSGVPRIQAAD